MNLPSPWAGIKIMYGIKHSSLTMQKGKWCSKGLLRRLIHFTLLNLSPRNAVLSKETGIMSSKSLTGALVAKTKPTRDTSAPTRSRGSFLGCWPWKAGVSGFTPESLDFSEFPGLPRILQVLKPQRLYSGWGGIKAPSTPSFTLLPCHFVLNSNRPHLLPLFSLWLKFGEICCGI
jgi:hypothetical protein